MILILKAMCKSSVLGFVLLFAFLFRLEKPSWRLFAIITTMTLGVLLMVAGEVSFSLLGFILVMSAAASSGFRWSLTQILLLRNPATSNPFSSIFFLAPVMFVTLLVIAIPVEGLPELRDAFYNLADAHGTGMSILILLFPGALAFCMTASEFALLQRTSVVTLSIAGIFKEVLTISTASIVFGDDKLTPINLAGLVITILTIAYYNYVKISRMQEEAKMEAQLAVHGANGDAGGQAYAPVLSADPDAGSGAGMGRQSTSDLIRNSLSISTSGDFGKGSKKSRSETPPKVSPIKRPEDLD